MFGIEFLDPATRWLNLTNLALGIVTLLCVAAVAWGVAVDLLERLRSRLPATADDHAFVVRGLGVTMADGGEPTDEKKS
ncbi:MAG: hypothetical protein ABR524_10085 [Thermoanaerobaculia bacterium]